MKTYIPFCGTYESELSYEIDNCVERYIEWINEEAEDQLIESDVDVNLYNEIDYDGICKSYTDYFADWVNAILGIQIKLNYLYMSSPKFYNFETDQCHVEVPEKDVEAIWNEIDKDDFAMWLETRLENRSGFYSYYSNILKDWDTDVTSWDSNQVALLFEYLEWLYIIKGDQMSLFADFLDKGGYEVVDDSISFRDYEEIIDDAKGVKYGA